MVFFEVTGVHDGFERSTKPMSGIKTGGLPDSIKKAIGDIDNLAHTRITAALSPGEKLRQKGISVTANPASGCICSTLRVAAGMIPMPS